MFPRGPSLILRIEQVSVDVNQHCKRLVRAIFAIELAESEGGCAFHMQYDWYKSVQLLWILLSFKVKKTVLPPNLRAKVSKSSRLQAVGG